MKNRSLLLFAALLSCLALSSCQETESSLSDHPLSAFESELRLWHWVDVEGMTCRDGSATGVGVRPGTDKKRWVIYLQGGGACFTEETCAGNRANYSKGDFDNAVASEFYESGILNTQNVTNPVKDWSLVFVPYCTGDVFSGTNESSYGLGLSEPQMFVGAENMEILLDYLKPYLEENGVEEILITGVSAGGFGTHLTYFSIKERFPEVQTHLINDSGPLMSDPNLFPVCLQLGFQFIFDLPLPSGFLFCCQPSWGMADIYTLAARYWPEDNFALISFTEDATIRYFFAPGQNTCTGGSVSGTMFREGLEHLRDNVFIPSGKWSSFYMQGDGHTVIQNDANFYNLSVQGKTVVEFVRDVMNGEVMQYQ